MKKRKCVLTAFLYRDGLAEGKWATQKGAVDALGISQAELSLALKLDALPAELVGLFESPGEITPYSVRVIREVIARDGLDVVVQRIAQHVSAGSKLSTRAALATIKGQAFAAKRALSGRGTSETAVPKGSSDSPKDLSDRYHRGVIQGKWANYSGCARALDLSRKNIRDAVCITALMDSLPYFRGMGGVTFVVGRKFLAFEKAWGRQALQQRARHLSFVMKGASIENILWAFNGENVQPSDLARIRIRKGRGARQLIIDCNHADFLFRYRREFELAICSVLQRLTLSGETIAMFRWARDTPKFKAAFAKGYAARHGN
ncbi:hypothetical protein VOM14_30985 [Paraburkholderia sp. MPAMCS5]|uniref:hypothetical protein n=1 Tax=Paraburkholderia sp. MPAMCS5 TaxID=3112563 RepID=UPI002E176F26|nr:hypothetical protein [Paraburkholderia sp. MPAMCS5]